MSITILSISSQVAFGPVGNSAAVPAMEALGATVYAVPTTILSHHPGHAKPAGLRVPAQDLSAMIDSLAALGVLDHLSAVLTGYFAANDQIFGVARAIRRLKEKNPDLVYLCDPVIGAETSGLYVPLPVAEAIKSVLLPLADIAMPNRFELEWLSGMTLESKDRIDDARRALGVQNLIAKSVVGEGGRLLTILCGSLGECSFQSSRRSNVPHGTGDLLSGLFLGHLLNGLNGATALSLALATLEEIIDLSVGSPVLDLSILRKMSMQ